MSKETRGGARKGAGRKPTPPMLKKTARSIKLPEWLWQWMDEQESTNRALLIESALIKLYELKEPIIKAAINDVRGVRK